MQDAIFKLVSETELTLFLSNGKGPGAFLLALIAIIFLVSKPFATSKLAELIRSWRGN